MGRKTARDTVMRLLYGWMLGGGGPGTISDTIEPVELTEQDMDYVRHIEQGVKDKLAQIDELIARCAIGWSIERMARVDLSILRVAVYEMLFREDIPFSVTINEAVDLAKKYSGEDAGAFINGVLAGVARAVGIRAGEEQK